jgi:hypothetical protein
MVCHPNEKLEAVNLYESYLEHRVNLVTCAAVQTTEQKRFTQNGSFENAEVKGFVRAVCS